MPKTIPPGDLTGRLEVRSLAHLMRLLTALRAADVVSSAERL